MARIAGVDIPRNKRVEIALTYIYGIGKPTSQRVLTEAGVNFDTRVKDLTEEEVNKIRAIIETVKVEGDLRKDVRLSIKRLMDIKCYRGLRHKMSPYIQGRYILVYKSVIRHFIIYITPKVSGSPPKAGTCQTDTYQI